MNIDENDMQGSRQWLADKKESYVKAKVDWLKTI